jgi:FkbH-like protein
MMMRKLSNLFYNPSETKEDGRRVKIYKEQLQRTKSEESIGNIEDYLATLGLMLKVYIDDLTQVARISQMTQKTNQFNLTTKRYTEREITALIKEEGSTVISINVQDKYGDNGLTGLAILDNTQSIIDTLLLSCRVLGRNIEYQFMDVVVDIAKRNKLDELSAAYIKTNKNHQVVDFYEKCGFVKLNESDEGFQYSLQVNSYNYLDVQYIEVRDGR